MHCYVLNLFIRVQREGVKQMLRSLTRIITTSSSEQQLHGVTDRNGPQHRGHTQSDSNATELVWNKKSKTERVQQNLKKKWKGGFHLPTVVIPSSQSDRATLRNEAISLMEATKGWHLAPIHQSPVHHTITVGPAVLKSNHSLASLIKEGKSTKKGLWTIVASSGSPPRLRQGSGLRHGLVLSFGLTCDP